MSRNIFRKSALEKLSTPEKLDQLITVTSPRAWLILCALGLAIVAIITWGIFGTINNRVQGNGMLIGQGVHDIVPLAQGQIVSVTVEPGDMIGARDIVATISQPELEQQIEEAEARMADQVAQLEQASLYGDQNITLQSDFIQKQVNNLQQSIKDNERMLVAEIQEVKVKEELLKDGLVTKTELLMAQQKMDETKGEIESLKAEMKYLSTQELNVESNLEKLMLSSKQRIDATKRLISQLKERLERYSNIRSPYKGEVLEVLVEMGDVASVGSSIVKISKVIDGKQLLHSVVYVAAKDGKKLKPGMEVMLAPATVKPQEFGYMRGTISYVSEYPATEKSIMKVLKNQQLVAQMLSIGAPFEVHAEFEITDNTVSGYQWTSGDGPPVNIYPGTPCSAWINISTQRPASLVMPALKNLFK